MQTSRTLIELCRDVVGDLGIAGGTLQTTVGSSLNNEQRNIVKWVKRADLLIQNLWVDWRFLWYQDPAVMVQAGSNVAIPTVPTWSAGITDIDRTSMYYGYGTPYARSIPFLPYERFKTLYASRPITAAVQPAFFTMDPGGNLLLSNTVVNDTSLTLDYWNTGKAMATDTDVSRIPATFDTIIVERAKILYAERENAAEIFTGSTAEYTDLLDKMQAVCLPDNTAGRRSRNDHTTIPSSYVD